MKCGYVAVLGLPNAGKSSLVNYLVGEEVAVVSHRRQTTRNSILGILNIENAQIIFVDTPGIHHSKNNLDKFMNKNVRNAIAAADVVLYLFDGSIKMDEEEKEYIENLSKKCEKLLLIQTKSDKKQEKFDFSAISISSQTGNGMKELVEKIVEFLPERQPMFDEELYTDKSINFLIAEKVRGIMLEEFDKEVPHGVAVVVTSFVEEQTLVKIDIDIICEREQHKGIIIGKGGKMLKKIGSQTREYCQQLLDKKCMINLFVKVDTNWRDKNIGQYGYN